MLDSFSFSATAILPILLIALLGYLLRRFNVLSEEFFSHAHKLVFQAALPALIFYQIWGMDFSVFPNLNYWLFCVGAMTLCYSLGLVLSGVFIKDRKKAGAMAQGMTRSTFSIVGLPLAEGLFGTAGLQLATLLLPTVIIFNNVFAVLMLSVYAPEQQKGDLKKNVQNVLLCIVKNPLILAMVLALAAKAFSLCLSVALPSFILSAVSSFSSIAQPLAILCLGAGFVRKSLRGRIRLALFASITKTVILPLVFCASAILFGFRDVELGLVCIIFGGPTTISSYIMAKNMGSDEVLTGQIVLLSTLMSAFTLFGLFFFLRTGAYL